MKKMNKIKKLARKTTGFFIRNGIGFLIGIIVAGTTAVLAATALLNSSEVSYNNTTSGLSSTNVKGALDELFDMAETHCPDGYYCAKAPNLKNAIRANNNLIITSPNLTTSSNNTSDASGLYVSTATNDGSQTYYFRGDVENNYVSFVGQTWRVVRINEDGTIRMIMENGINDDATYAFNSSSNNSPYMYYTNSNAKTQLESWYNTNIASNTNYANKVATGDYFCEQAKVKFDSSFTSVKASMEISYSYTPNFKCATDGNGYGLVNASIGLITYDEVIFAGGHYDKSNSKFYLFNNTKYWTMSTAGFSNEMGKAYGWFVLSNTLGYKAVDSSYCLRPVLNLKADTAVIGSGTSTDPYVVLP